MVEQTATKKVQQPAVGATKIDPRAEIHPTAKIAEDVVIGPWSVIGPNVEIGRGSIIGSHVVIERNTKMGERNRISAYASVGGEPQDLNYHGEDTWLEMGDDNVVREFVTLNRGSVGGGGITKIGNKNCFLAYSHVAHDCEIGNEVLFVNHAGIAGHVKVDDYAILGAYTAIHQFCHIGQYVFVSRAAETSKDVPPYLLIAGIPGEPRGLNTVGLKRRGFSQEAIRGLKKAYHIIYTRGLKLKEAREELVELAKEAPEVQVMIDFIDNSKRSIISKVCKRALRNY